MDKSPIKQKLEQLDGASATAMNLIALEENFFIAGVKKTNPKYFSLLAQAREIRKQTLKTLVKNSEGEVWCLSKHLLASSARLLKIGKKYYNEGRRGDAAELFNQANNLFSMFQSINSLQNKTKEKNNKTIKDDSLNKQLNNLVKDLINCCDE